MKGVFLGCTQFSEQLLKAVMEVDSFELQAIFTIPQNFSISYSETKVKNTNYADLSEHASSLGIPHYSVESEKGFRITDYADIIKELNPDVILVMGWYYMVPKSIREMARLGAWGIHASLLPKYAGGAPLVWAIIEGNKETGVTLFKLDSGTDDGDIIDQRAFPIEEDDTIKDVYHKATEHSKEILKNALSKPDQITFTPQDKSKIEVYPQRSPDDGEIDWTWEPRRINDFIRAQTKPYPGAWSLINGKKVTFWSAHVEEHQPK